MANPFLVLGGIAVGIIVATFGVLQVPGWVESAQDASAINDLSHAAIGEATSAAKLGTYTDGVTLAANADLLGVEFTPSSGVRLCVTASPTGDAYAAVAISPSGSFFARTNLTSEAAKGATGAAALTAAGELPAGVPTPIVGGDCAPGALIPGSDTAGGPGGGNPGGGSGGETTTEIAGDIVALGDVAAVAHTRNGTYALAEDGTIYRSYNGQATTLTLTGDITQAMQPANFQRGIAADADGNVYVTALYPHPTNQGPPSFGITQIAPDGSTHVVHSTPMGPISPNLENSPNGTVYAYMGGNIYRLVGGSLLPHSTYSVNDGFVAIADNGTAYLQDGSTIYSAVTGGASEPYVTDTQLRQFVATADGTLYGADASDGRLLRVTPGGTVEVVSADIGIALVELTGVSKSGTIYGFNSYSQAGQQVFSMDTRGAVTNVMR